MLGDTQSHQRPATCFMRIRWAPPPRRPPTPALGLTVSGQGCSEDGCCANTRQTSLSSVSLQWHPAPEWCLGFLDLCPLAHHDPSLTIFPMIRVPDFFVGTLCPLPCCSAHLHNPQCPLFPAPQHIPASTAFSAGASLKWNLTSQLQGITM